VAGTTGIASAQRELVDLVRARGDRPVPRLRQVPSALDLADLARLRPNAVNGRTTGTVLLGGTADGGAESVSLTGPDRVLAIIGEAGSGRTTALQTVVLQLQTQEIDLWVIDPRRGLLPVLDAPVFDAPVHYAYTVDDGTALLGELAARLAPRRPPRGLSPADLLSHLRRADPGRPAVLLIDDYDLLSPVGLSGPLGPVGELLPYAADVGLSVVVARGGSGRFGYDAGWQALVDAGATGLLLSGDPADGPVHRGIRAQRRAPGRGLLVRRAVSATVVQVARPAPPALGRRPSVAPLRLRTA
jgi:S-DNA-T family DNA segregation ATPase FtsK/SpoIIIE